MKKILVFAFALHNVACGQSPKENISSESADSINKMTVEAHVGEDSNQLSTIPLDTLEEIPVEVKKDNDAKPTEVKKAEEKASAQKNIREKSETEKTAVAEKEVEEQKVEKSEKSDLKNSVQKEDYFAEAINELRNQNLHKAVVLFEKSIAQNNIEAEMMLASMYADGVAGLPKNEEKAFKIVEKAALRGEPEAQFMLSSFYGDGVGVKLNEQKALYWLAEAAKNGSADAQEFMNLFQEAEKPVE